MSHEVTDNHVDVRTNVHSERNIYSHMEVRCDCGEWVKSFGVAGHLHTEPIVKECDCGEKWTIGAIKVNE